MMIGRIYNKIKRIPKMINYLLLKSGLKDVYFYFYIWKFIKKNRNSLQWKQFNLRHDWIGRIYTVESHSYEDSSLPEDILYSMTMEKIRPLIDWLQQNNLGEIMSANVKKIPDTYSYLIKFSPLFYEISIPWFLGRATLAYIIYWIFPYVKNLLQHVL